MKKFYFFIIPMLLFSLWSCDSGDTPDADDPIDYNFTVTYAEVLDVMEGESFIVTPTIVNEGRLILKYYITGGTKSNGEEFSWIDMNYLSIVGTEGTLDSNAGEITVHNNHIFPVGTNVIDVFVWYGELSYETTLSFTVNTVMPDAITYSPNDVTWNYDGTVTATSSPVLTIDGVAATDDYIFSLTSDTDKLQIDEATGAISPNPDYSPELGTDITLTPSIKITTSDGMQSTQFIGSTSLLKINIIKSASAQIGRFFIPLVEDVGSDGTATNFKVITVKSGNVKTAWTLSTLVEGYTEPYVAVDCVRDDLETPLVGDLPDVRLPIWGVQMTPNTVSGSIPATEEHESWLILDPKDLSLYSTSEHDVTATVWMQNEYVQYFDDGTTPSNLQFYVSTTHDYTSSTIIESQWTEVSTVVSAQTYYKTGGALKTDNIVGIPYPGTNVEDVNETVAHLKNVDNIWEGRQGPWLKAIYDMSGYLGKSNFIFAIKASTRAISLENVYPNGEAARAGNMHIANIYYTATEK